MKELLTNPAAYSAIAALSSGFAAWMMVMIHRQNALDAARPELVFTDWLRIPRAGAEDTIRIGQLENVGKGPALHIAFYLPDFDPEKPRVAISTQRISILSPGKPRDINWDAIPFWQQSTSLGAGEKLHSFKLGLYCFDTKGYRHNTIYHVTMHSDKDGILGGAEELGEGIYGRRVAKATPLWPTKWKRKLLTCVEKAKQLFKGIK